MSDQFQQLMNQAPAWAKEPAVLIGATVILGLLLLWLLSRLLRRPSADLEAPAAHIADEGLPVARSITPPPVAPFPPPLAEKPIAPPPPVPAPAPAPVIEAEPEPVPQPVAPVAPKPAAAPVIAPVSTPAPPVAAPAARVEPEPTAPPVIAPMPAPAPLAETPAAPAKPEPAAAPLAAAQDDLTRLKGVGPRLAARLNSVGVSSFAQIAALTPTAAEALDAQLGDFQGRMHRDRWIEQAGFLASGDIAGFESVFGKL